MRAALAIVLAGCVSAEGELQIPDADPAVFRSTVYPVLLADCGYPACHGDPARFFRIFGPGRTRLDPATEPYAPATAAELAESYARTRSMLVSPDGVARSPLLRKPLAVAAGGASHGGDDVWGQPIYRSKQDARFAALFFWATEEAR